MKRKLFSRFSMREEMINILYNLGKILDSAVVCCCPYLGIMV